MLRYPNQIPNTNVLSLLSLRQVAEKAPALRLLKNTQIQGARNPEECPSSAVADPAQGS
jgi:hypothetical protein